MHAGHPGFLKFRVTCTGLPSFFLRAQLYWIATMLEHFDKTIHWNVGLTRNIIKSLWYKMVIHSYLIMYRGYYMVARRYEFYFLSFTHTPCNITMIIVFHWCFCFVLFRISYLLIPIYIYLQGVSVEAVDPVFQAKMLDMLKQTGRWFIFPHYVNIILCSEMHQTPKFKPSLNLHFVKVLKHKIWQSKRDQCV